MVLNLIAALDRASTNQVRILPGPSLGDSKRGWFCHSDFTEWQNNTAIAANSWESNRSATADSSRPVGRKPCQGHFAAHRRRTATANGKEGVTSSSLVPGSANSLQKRFFACPK